MTNRNRKRIGVIGFLHESNTFISSPTTYQAFENDCLLERDDFYRTMSQSNHETSGFFSVLDEVSVPNKRSNPKRIQIIMTYVFFSLIISISYK